MLRIAVCLVIYLLLFGNAVYSQGSSQQQAKALVQTIQQKHYSPRTIDDEFSQLLFDQFLESLDPEKLFFTTADLNAFSSFRKLLDDELNGKSWTFISKITPLFKSRLLQADSIINELTLKPFDFSTNDFFSIAADTSWAVNEKEKKNKWYQALKYETLEGLADIAAVQFSQSGAINKKEVLSKEAQVRLMIKSRHLRHIKGILQTAGGFTISNTGIEI